MEEAVNAIIFNADKTQVLVMRRRDTPIWVLPGGAVDPGESPEEAALRELIEEADVKARIVRKTGEYTPLRLSKAFTHVFECQIEEGIPRATAESLAVGFYPIQDLPKVFFSIHEGWIQEALENPTTLIQRDLHELNYGAFIRFVMLHPITFLRFFSAKILKLPFHSS